MVKLSMCIVYCGMYTRQYITPATMYDIHCTSQESATDSPPYYQSVIVRILTWCDAIDSNMLCQNCSITDTHGGNVAHADR